MYMFVYVCICLYMYVYVSIVYMLCSPMLEEKKNLSIYLSMLDLPHLFLFNCFHGYYLFVTL